MTITRLFTTRGWMIVLAGFTVMGLGTGAAFTIGVFLKPLAQEFNWARSEIALAYSINMIVLGAFSFIMGAMSDRWGMTRVVLVGTLIMAVGMYLNRYLSSVWQFYVFYGLLMGMGKAAFHSPLMSYVARVFNKRRGLAVGIVFAGTGIGLFVLTPLTRYLITAIGWRLTFAYLALSIVVIGLPALWCFREKPGQKVEHSEEGLTANSQVKEDSEPKPPERFHWRNRSYWTMCGLHYFDCLCHSVPLVHVVAYATDRSITPEQGASVLGLVGLAAIAGRIVIPSMADRIGSRNGLLLTLILQTGMIPFLMVSDSLMMFYIFSVIFGIGWGGNSPMYPLMTREYFGTKRLGAIYGGTIVAASLGMAGGGYMGGLLFDVFGSYQASLWFSLVAGVISIGLIKFLKPLRRVRDKAPSVLRPVPAPAALEV